MPFVSCAVLGHDINFSVRIENSDIAVAELVHHIKATQPRMLGSFDNPDLILYKVDLPISDTIMERIHLGTVEYRQEQKLNCLSHVSFGATEALERCINILVVPHTAVGASTTTPDVSGLTAQLVFLSNKRGTAHFRIETLIQNEIHESVEPPKFIWAICEKFIAKRLITTKQKNMLYRDSLISEHFTVKKPNVNDINDLRCAGDEIRHYCSLLVEDRTWMYQYKRPLREKICPLYFNAVATYHIKRPAAQFTSEAVWPLEFVAEITKDTTTDRERCSYQPKSDYLFSYGDVPRISVEVCSDATNESDRYRLLLQSALLVRTINTVQHTGNSFVTIAIYIARGLSADWYLVYQSSKDDNQVRYFLQKSFNLETPIGEFQFFHQLYNFPFAFDLDEELPGYKSKLDELKSEVNAQRYTGFTTETQDAQNTEIITPRSNNRGGQFDDPSVSQALCEAGYQILYEPRLEDGWSRLYPLPPTVCRARGPNKGIKKVILKVAEQHEFNIHSYLLERKFARRYIVHIVASLPHTIGRIIATEEHLVLSMAPSDLLKAAGVHLAHQFLQGVQFIHHHQVAHLDLKPDNLVIERPSNKVYIIDFSVSLRVPGPNSRVTGFQGTKGWVAPEVAQELDRGYCPILADLWSAGKVLRYLTDRQQTFCGGIRSLAIRLQSPAPQQRPLLSTISLDALFAQHQPNPVNQKLRSDAMG